MEYFNLTIPSKKIYIRFARYSIRDFFKIINYNNEDEIFLIELAINEVIANIIEHTYNYEESHHIDINMCYFNKNEKKIIEIKVRDYGKKVEKDKLKHRELDDYKEGGLGIYIINQVFCVNKWLDVEEGNMLYLKKEL